MPQRGTRSTKDLRIVLRFNLLCLLCLFVAASVPAQNTSTSPRVRNISLKRFGEYPNQYKAGTFKISNVVLEDIRPAGKDDPISVFQVYDPRSGFRQSEPFKDAPFHPHGFLICSRSEVVEPLLREKDKWLNQKVNLYAVMRDVGLTIFHYTGYVTKIELLDAKGKVVQTIAEK